MPVRTASAALAAIFLVACSAAAPSSPPPAPQPPTKPAPATGATAPAPAQKPTSEPVAMGRTKVRVSTIGQPPTPSFNVAEFARLTGIFEANGLEVEVINNAGTTQAVPLVTSGQAEIVISGEDLILAVIAQGEPLKFYGAPANTQRFLFVARKEIKDWSDLRGKTMVTVTRGAGESNTAVAALKAHGIEESEVQWLTGLRMPALITNRAQGTLTTPEDFIGANDPNSYVLDSSPGQYLPFYTGSTIAAMTAWVDKNPQAMQAFMKSMMQAARKMKSDKGEFVRVGKLMNDKLTDDVLSKIWDLVKPMDYWALNGGIDRKRTEQFLPYFYQQQPELAAKSLIKSFDDLVDVRPARAALDEVGLVDDPKDPADWYRQ